ncbi:phosphatidate cytidylyltransferase, mitochondrial-like [Ruditapes philippinarum]|uniref:phosphatidate cytidylyltransferase, mitochondrial-like n=1 Tax=Ruditapes philippinarum TaxID=129788 RepID=UPI00295A87F8|nr:phosphatidate cytidylyltransferase, mitochondrial-like [Ruditapes philippinarum]
MVFLQANTKMVLCRRFCSEASVAKKDVFQRVLAGFPSGIQMAFAYGSGVFQQTGADMSKNMLDFIVVVDNPTEWHRENMEQNFKHYSFLKHLGAKTVSKIQNSYGAGIYFNTLVPFEQRLIKYGVIGTDVLISDLLNWDTLYVSGRLHKPVKIVKKPNSTELIEALHTNLSSAVHSSLLLLPENFTANELYMTITSLSYSGDFRMKFGEDKGKVSKIVAPNLPYFNKLYKPILNETKYLTYSEESELFMHTQSKETRCYHLNHVPNVVVDKLSDICKKTNPDIPRHEIVDVIAFDSKCNDFVFGSIASIVNKSSWSQSVKGILTAGLSKSIRYSWSKVKKMIKNS